ncbi:hypothetical protein FHS57_004267 [Runella defluvii]|uniref:Uncharacterized protein n=1 Tax=Runella defluvii TaxID=370973 RepID=A0A7W5ZMP0_9BACT|nr:hypothetical protein [Runella defluvii]
MNKHEVGMGDLSVNFSQPSIRNGVWQIANIEVLNHRGHNCSKNRKAIT